MPQPPLNNKLEYVDLATVYGRPTFLAQNMAGRKNGKGDIMPLRRISGSTKTDTKKNKIQMSQKFVSQTAHAGERKNFWTWGRKEKKYGEDKMKNILKKFSNNFQKSFTFWA